MSEAEDWEFENGRWLQGRALRRGLWFSDDPARNHDHCQFCWETLAPPETRALHEGYVLMTDPGAGAWVCVMCFEKYRDRLELVEGA